MTISFQCTGCDSTLKVADELAGRKAKCPKCKTLLIIPDGPAAAVTTAPARRRIAPKPPAPADEPDETLDEAEEPARARRRSKAKKQKKAKGSLLVPLLLAGAVVMLLLCGGGGFAAWWFLWPAAAQDDAYFYPDNVQLVAQIQMDQLLNSGAVQQARQTFPEFDQKVLAQFGGPSGSMDVSNLGPAYLAFQQTPPVAAQPNFVDIQHFRKPTTVADIQNGIKKDNPNATFTETKVGRFTVYDYQIPNPQTGANVATSFLMPDNKRQVIGPTPLLHTILDRNKKVDLPDKLQATIKQTDFTATVAIAATKDFVPRSNFAPPPPGPGRPAPGIPPPPPAASPFDRVDGWSITAKITNDADVNVTAICQDPQAANALLDIINKSIKDLKNPLLMAMLPPEIKDLVDINPQANGANVTVSKTIKVAPLLKMAKEQQQKKNNPFGFPQFGR